MKRIMEINQAEGGEDSANFVFTLAQAYERYFSRSGWTHS